MSQQLLFAMVSFFFLIMNPQGASAAVIEGQSGITRVAISVSGEPVVYTDRVQEEPPAILIEFHSRNILSELEPVVPLASGIIKEIRSDYDHRLFGKRTLKTITLILTQPAQYKITQSLRQILIDVETPYSLMRGTLDVGRGVTILGIEDRNTLLQRFEAMSAALGKVSQSAVPVAKLLEPVVVSKAAIPRLITSPKTPLAVPASQKGVGGFWFGLILGTAGVGMIGLYRRKRYKASALTGEPVLPKAGQASTLLDQLVPKALARQGQEIIESKKIADLGTLWIVKQDQQRCGVLCLNAGSFFERRIIKQIHEIFQKETLRSGTVWALGFFTAPAQIFAKEQGINVVPYDEVLKLIETELANSVSDQETEKLQLQLVNAERELERSQERLKTLEGQLSDYKDVRKQAAAELEERVKELEVLQRKDQRGELSLRAEREDKDQLERQIAGLEATVSSKKAELMQKEQTIEALFEASEKLDKETVILKERLGESEECLKRERIGREKLETQLAQIEQTPVMKKRFEVEVDGKAKQRETQHSAKPTNDKKILRKEQKVPKVAGLAKHRKEAIRQKTSLVDLNSLGDRGLAVRIESSRAGVSPLMGTVKEISSNALTIEGDNEVAFSGVLSIELFPFGSPVPIKAKGRLIRQERLRNNSKIRIEISIASISRGNRNRLSAYIRKLEEPLLSPLSGSV